MKRSVRVIRTCETCGQTFTRLACHVSRDGRGRYCSMACSANSADLKRKRLERREQIRSRNKVRLMDTIEGIARSGEAFPGNTTLGRTLGLGTETVQIFLREMQADGLITIRLFRLGAGIPGRQVTITASGLTTAEPTRPSMYGTPRAKDKAQTELEKAKTRLRQRGFIVFNAYVTDGRSAGDLVKVDGKCFRPAEVIAKAQAVGMH